jgi:hypothetical protein
LGSGLGARILGRLDRFRSRADGIGQPDRARAVHGGLEAGVTTHATPFPAALWGRAGAISSQARIQAPL